MSQIAKGNSRFEPIVPGQVFYCPACMDVYGQIERGVKRCACSASQWLPKTRGGSDFPTPFEVCWYCQAEIIPSGTRWSTYYCAGCRPIVLELNDRLDEAKQVSLPIGRHSLMYGHWNYARPYTAAPVVWAWAQGRLAAAWSRHSESLPSADWVHFAPTLRRLADEQQAAALEELTRQLQDVAPDHLLEMIREVNASLAEWRGERD